MKLSTHLSGRSLFHGTEERFARRFNKVMAIEAKYRVWRWVRESGISTGGAADARGRLALANWFPLIPLKDAE
jgi:hypothetical protein